MEAPQAGPQCLPQISILLFPSQSYISEISRLIEAVAILMGIVILHIHTARDDVIR